MAEPFAQQRRLDGQSPNSTSGEHILTECHHCRARNEVERKYCRECGSPLFGPCPECGETVGLAEKFCGGCGFAVGESFHERLQAAQSILREGLALRGAAQFAQAQLHFRRLLGDPDPLLHGLRRSAEQAARQCDEAMREAGRRREELFTAAQAAMEQADFDRAAALLEQVPEGIRTNEVRQLLTRALAFREESEQLVRMIREALAAREYLGLLPKVERLLVLKPQHEQARAMIGKLRVLEHEGQGQRRDQSHALAKQLLAAGKAAESIELLERIPADMRTPDVAKTLEFARETAWLRRQLKSSLLLTDTLVRLGEKYLKLHTGDFPTAQLVEQLRQRRAAHATNGYSTPLRALPATPAIGCAVEILGAWKRIALADGVRPVLGARYEQFSTAAGLALEGLGKAVLSPRFRLETDDKFWQRLSRAVRKRDANVAWGLDLGAHSLKAIRLRLNGQGEVLAEAAEQLPHETPLNQPGADAAALVTRAFERLRAKHDLTDGRLCVSFSGAGLFSRSFKLPPVDAKKIPELMEYETLQQIPVPIDQVAWDYHVFGANDPANRYDREAALFAVRRAALRERLTLLELVDLRPDVLQADCLAVYNLLAFENLLPAPRGSDLDDENVTMTLDLGADVMHAVVGHAQCVWTRTASTGGNLFTKALVKELKFTHADAERYKRQPYSAPAGHALDIAMQPAFQALFEEVHRTITYYGTQHRRRRIQRILLLGGGARLHGLVEALTLSCHETEQINFV